MDIKRLDVSESGIVRVRKYHVYVKWKKKGQSSLMTTVLKKIRHSHYADTGINIM